MGAAVGRMRGVAAERHERGLADRDGVGTERECLGHVGPRPDAAGNDQLDGPAHPHLVERLDGLAQGGERRDAGVLDEDLRARCGAALHSVEHHDVGARLHRQLDVVEDAGGAELHVDRHLPVADLAQLGDLDRQVVRARPIRMAARRPLIDAGGERTHGGHSPAELLTEQHATPARLRTLPDDDLDRIGAAEVVRVEAVARRQTLVDERLRRAALLGRHATVARRRGSPDCRGRAADRLLRARRERSEAHAGDRDRRREGDRLLRMARAEHRRRRTALTVALEGIARQRRGQKHEVVEGRQRALRAESADLVEPARRRLLDVGEDVAVEREALLALSHPQYAPCPSSECQW